MKDITKKYSNGELTIVWKPSLCIHSTKCWKGADALPEVFNPSERPWIKPDAASSEKIMAHVNQCPSGALSFYLNEDEIKKEDLSPSTIVEPSPNGPLLVYGNITLKDKEGNETSRSKVTAFCRCGASANKPFCDGAHHQIKFNDSQ